MDIERFSQYLERRAYSAHTVDNYMLDVELFFAQINKPATEVDRYDIDTFIDQQREAGLVAVTINRRLATLKHFFDFVLEQQDVIQDNPVRRTHFLRRPRPLPRPFQAQELDRFFAVVNDLRDRAIFTLMLRAGLRVSEVAKLEVVDVDLQAGTLWVHEGKGRRDRLVYLSADALELLRGCLAKRPPLHHKQLFWNHKRKGETLSSKAIQKAMQRYCTKAGIEGSCHRLRHTFATQLLENGAQLLTVRDFLGHSSVMTSAGYVRLSNQQVKHEYYRSMASAMEQLELSNVETDSQELDQSKS